ncbi:MAG: 5-bromo-4-chloroindolyl phosphate hydrolysis family protein [Oscillospiraceae bacterium]|nr:5-bromo-4-chloroindolyl phosphate hydrolysis family protein [Oscillospiraceae bacterium]
MKNKGSGGLIGIIAIIAAILFFTAKGLFPVLTGMLKALLGIIVVGVIILVIAVVYFAFRKTDAKQAEDEKSKLNSQLAKGRANLMDLRNIGLRIKNSEIRSVNDDICKTVDKILSTLKKQPEDITKMRQFFSYYLPTLTNILKKYVAIEESGVPADNIVQSTINCLGDIKKATEKQYTALFDNDILDMSVEMEALTIACKRDGLLTDKDFETE